MKRNPLKMPGFLAFSLTAVLTVSIIHLLIMYMGHIHSHQGTVTVFTIMVESLTLGAVVFPVLYLLIRRRVLGSELLRLKAEKALRETETRYRHLFSSVKDAIIIADLDRNIIDANQPALRNMFGYELDEIRGRNASLLYASIEGYEAAGQAVFGEHGDTTGRLMEITYKRKDGTVFPAELLALKLTNDQGRIIGNTGVIRDITERKDAEETLKEREYWLSESQRAAQVGTYNFNVLNNTWESTEVLDEIFGIDSSYEKTAEGWLNIVHPYHREMMGEYLRKLLEQKTRFDKEYKIIRISDKQERWLYGRGELILDRSGRPRNLIGTIQDITLRKEAENALVESEEKFRAVFESAPDAILLADTDTGIIMDANPAASRLMGRPASEIVGMHQSDIHPPEDEQYSRDMFREHVKERVRTRPSEHKVISANGALVPVEIKAHTFTYQGKNVIMGVFRDITERKRAERLIIESEERFRGAFENAAIGASMVDTTGRFIDINRALCEMLGYTEGELLSKTFSDITHPDDINIGLEQLKTMLSGHYDRTRFEKRYIRKNGEVVHTIISPSLIRNAAGEPLHFVTLWQDITERKLAEEKIITSLKEKEVLLKEVHHRVKNNMAVISSMLSLQSGYVDDRKYLQMFRESQGRIKSMALVHEKLYQSEDFTKIDVRDYIKALLSNIQIMLSGEKDTLTEIEVDDIELDIDTLIPCGLIINELLTNSFKYAFNGSGKPSLGLSLKKLDAHSAELTVSDNGPGLPDGFDITASKGLGFKLVSTLADQINGSLDIQNAGGLLLRVRFPLGRK